MLLLVTRNHLRCLPPLWFCLSMERRRRTTTTSTTPLDYSLVGTYRTILSHSSILILTNSSPYLTTIILDNFGYPSSCGFKHLTYKNGCINSDNDGEEDLVCTFISHRQPGLVTQPIISSMPQISIVGTQLVTGFVEGRNGTSLDEATANVVLHDIDDHRIEASTSTSTSTSTSAIKSLSFPIMVACWTEFIVAIYLVVAITRNYLSRGRDKSVVFCSDARCSSTRSGRGGGGRRRLSSSMSKSPSSRRDYRIQYEPVSYASTPVNMRKTKRLLRSKTRSGTWRRVDNDM
jgi:hypothetical protein